MFMRTVRITIIFALILTGCSKSPSLYEMDQSTAFSYLKAKYDKGDYFAAAEGLDYYTLNYSGSAQIDSAQFLLGMAHFEMKEYFLASSAFEELSRRFPRSPLVAEAMFMIGVSYRELSPKYALDQEHTYDCIDAFQAFIDFFPESKEKVKEAQRYIEQCREKLSHKEYAAGIIYLKMKDYRAASLYFRKVIEQYYDTPWAARSTYQLGRALSGQRLDEEAVQAFRLFLNKYPDHEWQVKAESALAKLLKTPTG